MFSIQEVTMKKFFTYIVLIMLSVVFVSCGLNNSSETINTTGLVYNEVDLLDISGDTMAGFKLTESYLVVGSYSIAYMYMNVYDATSGELIYNTHESFSDFYVYQFDASDDYLVYIGKDVETDTIFVKRYSFKEEQLMSLAVDDRSDLKTSENPIQIDNDHILVNLSSGFQEQGYTYLIDADAMTSSNLLTSYDINGIIMGGTYEAIYGGANRVLFNQIVMSSYHYVNTYNQVDIFDVNDLTKNRTLNVSIGDEETCNVLHAQMIDSYIALKSICSNEVNQFDIYNIQDETDFINIEILYSIDDFKIKGINDEFIIFTNGNYERENSRVLVYNRLTEGITEIVKPSDYLEFFGGISYLIDNQILMIHNQTLYVYHIGNQTYLQIDDDYQIDRVYGIYNNQLIFYGEYQNESSIFAYHTVRHEFIKIQEMDTTSFMVNLSDNNISILTYEEDLKLHIYN